MADEQAISHRDETSPHPRCLSVFETWHRGKPFTKEIYEGMSCIESAGGLESFAAEVRAEVNRLMDERSHGIYGVPFVKERYIGTLLDVLARRIAPDTKRLHDEMFDVAFDSRHLLGEHEKLQDLLREATKLADSLTVLRINSLVTLISSK